MPRLVSSPRGSTRAQKNGSNCCLWSVEKDVPPEDKMVVVKHLTAILKLMKNRKANLLDLLDSISKRCPTDAFPRLGTVEVISWTHPDARQRVLFSDCLLLEEVECAFGTTELGVEKVFSSRGGLLKEPIMSALSSRLSR